MTPLQRTATARSGAGRRAGARGLLRSRRFWVGFTLACILLTIFDHLQTLTESVLNAGAAYHRLVATGFKPLYPRNSVILLIKDGVEPQEVTMVNVCQQRAFLARVLDAIRAAQPAVVVIDKQFSAGSCPTQTEGTTALQRAVKGLLESGIPLVIGRDSDRQGRLSPSIPFPSGANGKRLQFASMHFHEDVKRASFEWSGFFDEDGKAVTLETLSYAAATARHPNLLELNPRLRRFHERRSYPFVVFFPAGGFGSSTFSAIQLLCGTDAGTATDWRTCATPDAQVLGRVRSQIVLIGESAPGVDQHETVVGDMPGVWLHTNYVEAILNDDLLRPLPAFVTYLYGFLVFFVVELALLGKGRQLVKAAVAIGIVVAAYGICFLVVELSGVYLNPGLGLIALTFTQVTDIIRRRLMPEEAT